MHESAAISIYLGPNKPLLLIAYSSAMSTAQWQIHRIGGITFLSKKIVLLPYILKNKKKMFSLFAYPFLARKVIILQIKQVFSLEKNEFCIPAIEQ